MRRITKLVLLSAVVPFVFSCAKDNQSEPVLKEGFKLFATIDSEVQESTRSFLSESVKVLWNGDETIKGYGSNTYESTGMTIDATDGRVAEFSFPTLVEGDQLLYAIYPAVNASGDNSEEMGVFIPSEQNAVSGTFDPAAMASIGRVKDGNRIAFKNIGALLSLTINNNNITSVSLSATEANGGSLAGNSLVAIDNSDNVTVVAEGSQKSVSLNGGLTSGETYYFVVYPGEYSNLKIVVTNTEGETATYRNTNPITVGRNDIWRIANLTIPETKWESDTPVIENLAELDMTTKEVGCSSYSTSTTYGDWVIVNGANNNKGWEFFKMGGKNETLADNNPCYIYTTKAYSKAVNKIVVHFPAGSLPAAGMSVNSWGVEVYSDEDLSELVDYVEGDAITKQDQTVEFFPSDGVTWEAGYYYCINWDLANTTKTNGIIWVDKITLVSMSGGSSSATYSVTYDANGGEGTVPLDNTTYSDDVFTVTVQESSLTRSGYSFAGWNTKADGTGSSYVAGDHFIISRNVTLYAQWDIIRYSITKSVNEHGSFTVKDGNGNEVSSAPVGTNLILEAAPDYGYAFTKFTIDYTKADGTHGQSNFTVNPKPYTMPASDITITLVLEEVETYAVTWKVGTTTYRTDNLQAGDVISLPTSPDPEATGFTGHTFMGWTSSESVNPDGTGISYVENGASVTADITYHAVFAEGSDSPATLTELDSSYSLTAGDELVIVAGNIGMYQSTHGTTYVEKFTFSNDVSDIASDAKKHWTVSKVGEGYYLGDSNNGFLYTSGSNNLAVNSSSKSAIELDYDSLNSSFNIIINNHWLSFRDDLDNKYWRLGGSLMSNHSGTISLTLYKYTPAGTGSLSNYKLVMP